MKINVGGKLFSLQYDYIRGTCKDNHTSEKYIQTTSSRWFEFETLRTHL
jgi:hypothetical protein